MSLTQASSVSEEKAASATSFETSALAKRKLGLKATMEAAANGMEKLRD